MSKSETEKSVVDRYLEISNLVVEECLQNAAKKLNVTFDGIIQNKLAEVYEVVGFALGKAVMPSPSALRKAMMENHESGKKTPAAIEKAGPEGNKPTNPVNDMFDNFGGQTQ